MARFMSDKGKCVDEMFVGNGKCPHCGKVVNYRLVRKVRNCLTVGRYIKCDFCGTMEEINYRDYKIIKRIKA